MTDETVFSDNPEDMAVKWYEKGAERLHIVDLNGAVNGRPANKKTIEKIVNSVPIPVELGGGIRDMETLDGYLDLGLHYVILGTVVHKDPEFVKRACSKYPGKIILGIDAKEGNVAVEGWTEETGLSPVELAKRFEGTEMSAIIYTDIQRDGMKTGPSVDATRSLARAISLPVIASGGISDILDISKVLTLSKDGVVGMITGRALYDGTLDLSEAIKIAKE